eukprot:m.63756 g.63756  ORF g.63756 m.63756 type:complete len:305 (+) comp7477_c0_seq2:52-966(+)
MATVSARYARIEKLGEGTFGVVYKAQDKETGAIVALKRIRLDSEEEGVPCTALREISLLKELKHPNIVCLFDVLCTDKRLTLVFEYCDQDLKKFLDNCNNDVDAATIQSCVFQMLSGIAYCHENFVLHRDIKPQNLLLNKRGQLKIADFGLARAFGIPVKSYSHEVVTLWYRAPDVLMGSNNYSTSIDIWSAGCVFAEMARGGQPLFPGQPSTQLDIIFEMLGPPVESEWPEMTRLPEYKGPYTTAKQPSQLPQAVPQLEPAGFELLECMLQYSPLARITAADALSHPFFANLPPEVRKLSEMQ